MDEEFEEQEWTSGAVSDGEDQSGSRNPPEQVISRCMQLFAQPDYIMEPNIFNTLKKYFLAGGDPETVIETLCTNYKAVSGLANLIAEWLILSGVQVLDVQSLVESHLKDMIVRTFDAAKADSIFQEEGVTPAWLSDIIKHPTWRALIYRLAEEFPDCMMLNFTIKLISDAGFQAEITSLSTASQQIEVFSRIVNTSVSNVLSAGAGGGGRHNTSSTQMAEFADMVCHGQHTYVYTQALLHALTLATDGRPCDPATTPGGGGANVRRLSQEVTRAAVQRGHNVTPIILALNGAAQQPRAAVALSSMLARGALNPADVTVLYKLYISASPPPVTLIRSPTFLELLVQALFKPGVRINPDYLSKYIHLLAYAASVSEKRSCVGRDTVSDSGGDGSSDTVVCRDELPATVEALQRVHSICQNSKTAVELLSELEPLYQCIRFPVVSVCVLVWVEATVTEPSFFKLCTEHTPLHLALLDEVAACHVLLHDKLLELYVRLFESDQSELEILVQLEMRKMLLDRLVCLLSRGAVESVIGYVHSCWLRADTDVSLIRYFVHEVLHLVAPPYSQTLMQRLLPLVASEEVTGGCAGARDSLVEQFVTHCRQNMTSATEVTS